MNVYEVIKGPFLTEKGTGLQEKYNQVVMKVDPRANKIEIKRAVEELLKVKVDQVRTSNRKGKKRRVGRYAGQASDWKKAVVRLAEGSNIDFLQGL